MNDPKRILIVILGLITLSVFVFGIKDKMDSNGYRKQVSYTTAIPSKDKDNFNYIVDSQQGRVLANGDFTTKDAKLAKFDEMNKGYTYVSRVKEHYTMHTSTTCDGDGHCTTNTYYSWDYNGSDELYADRISFMGRDYPTTLFSYGRFEINANCEEFSSPGSNGGFFGGKKGCVDGDYYLSDDDRYTYTVIPVTFNASFLATTFGGLKPYNEKAISLQNKSIEQILKDVGKYQIISFWVVTVILILLCIGAVVAAYAWVMADGWFSLDE